MKNRRIFLALAVVCSFVAAYVSYTLLMTHVTGKSAASWFDLGCSADGGEGSADCSAVLESPYSYIPPRTEGRKGGIPAAFLGLVYYTALGIWFVGVGRLSRERRRLHFLPMSTVGFGLAGSAYFMFIMFGKLDHWCTWCLVTHGLNLIIAVCIIGLWPRAVGTLGDESDGGKKSNATVNVVLGPSWRVVLLTLLAIMFASYAELNLMGMKSWKRAAENSKELADRYEAKLLTLQTDGGLLVAMWKTKREVAIARRGDDPVRHENGGDVEPLDVVVFSDFECPSCARFALFFEQNIVPLFGGHIRTTFKHYPIDGKCNDFASRTLHPHACAAGSMAEAARAVGGSEAFWKAHDFLFRNRKALASGRIGIGDVALAIEVDELAMTPHMGSASALARIREDIALAGSIGVRGTPSVFVEGKLVDSLAKNGVAFWDALSDDFFARAGIARPASTRPPKNGATPNSPGRRGGR